MLYFHPDKSLSRVDKRSLLTKFFGVEGPLFIVQAIFPKESVSVSDFGMLIVSSLGHNIKHIRKALKRALNIIVWNFLFEV